MRFEASIGNYVDGVVLAPVIQRFVDADPNDSDKSVTVPNGEMWKINFIYIKLVTDATVGNRQIVLESQNSSGVVIGRISAGAVQAASLTRYYVCMQGTYRETAFVNTDIQMPIPTDAYIISGTTLRVYDSAAVSAAGDDMTVAYSVQVFKGM